MGTRSTITFIEKYKDEEVPLVNIYQQFDGYINGVGHELARWLSDKILINGLSDPEQRYQWKYCNGAGCLAAKFIGDMKTDTGGFYITTLDNKQDYNYEVVVDFVTEETQANDCITITVTFYNETQPFFVGTPQELLEFDENEYWRKLEENEES